MHVYENYLNRFQIYPQFITEAPEETLEMVVVIPLYRESKYIQKTIESLIETTSPAYYTEVIFVINDHDKSPGEDIVDNDQVQQLITLYNVDRPDMKFYAIRLRNIRSKIAGVGHARKTGMDEAVRRFEYLKKDGLILCLDGDCQVAHNYLVAVHQAMHDNQNFQAASIQFEHRLDQHHANEIIEYETHLRYFIDAQRRIGLPFAYQTVGSSMVVRASSYSSMGGMNQRKAGEDFYFLQKFIANNSVFEINDTTVFPSDRESDRVPFGTGKAINDLKETQSHFLSYHPECFEHIGKFIELMEGVFTNTKTPQQILDHIHSSLSEFLVSVDFVNRMKEISKNTTDISSFRKRFFQWYNAFLFMKSLHYLRDHGFPSENIQSISIPYIEKYYGKKEDDLKGALFFFREKARKGFYTNAVPL